MARSRIEETVDAQPPEPPWWRENWWVWLLVLLLFVALLLAFFFLRGDDNEANGGRVTVPAVVGLEEAEARARIEEAGLEPSVDRVASADPDGEVIAQEPGEGAQLDRGERVLLSVSAGGADAGTTTRTETETQTETATQTETDTETTTETETETQTVTTEPETAEVPDVVGSDHVEAGEAIDDRGLIADSYPVESSEQRGTVVAQNPSPGNELRSGEHVRINVAIGSGSRGSARVPDVTGAGEQEARTRLREAGFTVRTIDRDTPEPDNEGEVIQQQPEPRQAPRLTQVTIYVGR